MATPDVSRLGQLEAPRRPDNSRRDRLALLLALGVWALSFLVVAVLFLEGRVLNIAFDCYMTATRHFWARQPLYDLKTILGFVYLPQSAIIDTPFSWLSPRLGGLVWRAFGWGLYAHALWRFILRIAPERAQKWFLVATLLAVGPSISSLANGQATVLLTASMMHATLELMAQRWGRATTWLISGLAVKPLMAVLLGLTWLLYRPMRWRISLGLALFVLAPWLLGPAPYVAAQFRDALAKLHLAERPDELFEDARSLIWRAGWVMPHGVYLVVRLVAALGALAAAWFARARCREPWASLLLLAAAGAYLMLFNPRTQSGTYVIVAPVAALAAVMFLLEQRRAAAAAMCAIIVCWCSSPRQGPAFAEHWLKPLACMAFCAVLFSRRPGKAPR